MKNKKILAFFLSSFTWVVWAQEMPVEKKVEKDEKEAEITDRFKQNPEFVDPPIEQINKQDKQNICAKYKKKYISYYGFVYYVNHRCEREEIEGSQIYELTRKNIKISEVNGEVVAALKKFSQLSKPSSLRGCKELEGNYITFSYVDVYLVENCKKRMFPDWATYENHRGQISKAKKLLYALLWEEFNGLKNGEDFQSVIDQEFRDLLSQDSEIEIIPIDEACKGIIGKHVTYLGDIYFIEPISNSKSSFFCKKKVIDSGQFTKKHVTTKLRLQELTSSQAFSIPTVKEPL